MFKLFRKPQRPLAFRIGDIILPGNGTAYYVEPGDIPRLVQMRVIPVGKSTAKEEE